MTGSGLPALVVAPAEPALLGAIQASQSLSNWISTALSERGEIKRVQDPVALAYLSLALDHREALLALVVVGARSSVMALLRPAWEAVVRGLWTNQLATEAHVREIHAGRGGPTLNSMIMGLQRTEGLGLVLGQIQRSHGRALDDYVHGGARQVTRWMGAGGIAPRHSDEEMMEALAFADAIGLVACAARESIMGRAIQPFLDRMEGLHGANNAVDTKAPSPGSV